MCLFAKNVISNCKPIYKMISSKKQHTHFETDVEPEKTNDHRRHQIDHENATRKPSLL